MMNRAFETGILIKRNGDEIPVCVPKALDSGEPDYNILYTVRQKSNKANRYNVVIQDIFYDKKLVVFKFPKCQSRKFIFPGSIPAYLMVRGKVNMVRLAYLPSDFSLEDDMTSPKIYRCRISTVRDNYYYANVKVVYNSVFTGKFVVVKFANSH